MNAVLVMSLLVGSCLAQDTTTHRPHSTREPNEVDNIAFNYNAHTHHMIIKQHSGHITNCYIATLTADQLATVHTDAGIRTIEIALLGQLSSATAIKPATLTIAEVHACGASLLHGTNVHYFTL